MPRHPSPRDAASQPKRTNTSTARLPTPKNSHNFNLLLSFLNIRTLPIFQVFIIFKLRFVPRSSGEIKRMFYTTYLLTKVQYRFCIFFCNRYKSHNDAVSSVLSFILMLIIILSSKTERYSMWQFPRSLPRCHKACAQHVYLEAAHARNHS